MFRPDCWPLCKEIEIHCGWRAGGQASVRVERDRGKGQRRRGGEGGGVAVAAAGDGDWTSTGVRVGAATLFGLSHAVAERQAIKALTNAPRARHIQ